MLKHVGELPGKPVAAHLYELSNRVPIRIGQAWNELYLVVSSFKVIVLFNIAAQTVHEINIIMVQL